MSDLPLKVVNVVARLNIGGPAIQVALATAKMGAPRYETRLVSGTVAADEGDMTDYARERGVEPLIIPELGRELHPMRDVVTLWKLVRLIRRIAPHVVHTHTAKAGALGRLAARLAGVPVVVHTFHGHVFRGYFDRFRTGAFIRLERLGARLSDKLITLSDELRRELAVEYGIAPSEHIAVIPIGLDLEPLAGAPRKSGRFRRELGIVENAPLVGIVGRLVRVKNHALFLDAAVRVRKELPAARFVIVGDGELRDEVQTRIAALGLRDCVTITGWRRDPAAFYGDLDVNVVCSINEGTPLTLIEAMTAGVPVVATAVGGIPDVLDHGRLGALVPEGDPNALAAAVTKTLGRPPEMNAARSSMLNRYGADRLVRDLDGLYRSLLAEKRADLERASR